MNYAIRRALYAAARGQRSRKRDHGPVVRLDGYTVYRGRPRLPYGIAAGPLARVTHIPYAIYTAWSGGRLVGQLMRWRCGAETLQFETMTEPRMPLCLVCVACALRTAVKSPM